MPRKGGNSQVDRAGRHPRQSFHVHSTWSDGRAALEEMIAEAEARGWEYVGISDHSRSAAYAKGLTVERVKESKVEIEKLRKKYKIHIFWGTSAIFSKTGLWITGQTPGELRFRDRFRALELHPSRSGDDAPYHQGAQNKYVTILGHMTGRLVLSAKATRSIRRR